MPIDNYGVLIGTGQDRRREPGQPTPHYQILARAAGQAHRIAVNVASSQAPEALLYVVHEDFSHPILETLSQMPEGWHPIPSRAGGVALDYIRANLVNPAEMRSLPAEIPGEANDLADILDAYVLRAISDPDARLYAFGEPWGPEEAVADGIFGFTPSRGVHNIHMNQGNDGAFTRDDGVWQDGALLLQFPAAQRWVAVFLAFQGQDWHTDDVTGHGLAQDVPASIQVVAALVNPAEPGQPETVTLINASPDAVDLTGWTLADRGKHRLRLPEVWVAPGETLRVPATAPFALGNSGGLITVLNPAGLKVHGVTYTAAAAASRGWTVVP